MKNTLVASKATRRTRNISMELINFLKGSFLHPQWLSDRYHAKSRNVLKTITSGKVLDIGSGNCNHTALFSSDVQVIRLDYPDTNSLYLLKPDIYANALELPLRDGSISHILLLEVLEHVFDYQKVLVECQRVLAPDGQLFFSVPFVYPVHDAPYDFHRFTVHGIVGELKRAGFVVEHIRQHGNSIVVALQMMNLSLLELVKNKVKKHILVGVLLMPVVYLFCLFNNFMAIPFLGIQSNDAAVFGHFVVTRSGK